jgi:hypothetical protein
VEAAVSTTELHATLLAMGVRSMVAHREHGLWAVRFRVSGRDYAGTGRDLIGAVGAALMAKNVDRRVSCECWVD